MRAAVLRGAFAGSFALAFACAAGVSAEPMFMGLGRLPGPGCCSYSHGLEVSGDGSTAAGYNNASGQWEAFRWTSADGMVGLGFLPPPTQSYRLSWARGLSEDGSTIVGWSTIPGDVEHEAFRWTSSEGMVSLGGLSGSEACGVSADGSTLVGTSGNEAFRWTSSSGIVGLGDLPGGTFSSTASDISADGSTIVGGSSGASGNEAFRWTSDDGMVGLGDLPGGSFSSGAAAVSADGSTVVGASVVASGSEAYRWTSREGMVGLGLLPGTTDSGATDVSGDGSTIVGVSARYDPDYETYVYRPFIWDATHGMRDLVTVLTDLGLGPALGGWSLESANAISDDGLTIVGTGFTGATGYEAWVAVIPEPEGNSLLFAGVLALLGLDRWRRARVGKESP